MNAPRCEIKSVTTPGAMLCDGLVDMLPGGEGFIVSGDWIGELPAIGSATELNMDLIGRNGKRYELKIPVICTGHDPETFQVNRKG